MCSRVIRLIIQLCHGGFDAIILTLLNCELGALVFEHFCQCNVLHRPGSLFCSSESLGCNLKEILSRGLSHHKETFLNHDAELASFLRGLEEGFALVDLLSKLCLKT